MKLQMRQLISGGHVKCFWVTAVTVKELVDAVRTQKNTIQVFKILIEDGQTS